jgi:hypothetical protein
MIFRKKKEILEPYSIEQCSSCNKTVKRKFKEGDHVFKPLEKCTSCGNGQIIISKIFGEPIK